MASRVTKQFKAFTARAADGVIAEPINVAHAKTISVAISIPGTAALDIKCQAAIGLVAPDFSAAKTATNAWDYQGMYDLQSALHVNGDTGVTYAAPGTADVRLFEINVNAVNWISFEVDNYSAGSVTVEAIRVDNQ